MYVGAYSALVLEVYYALIANIKSIYRNLGVTQLIMINEQKLQFWMFRMFMLLSSSRLWLSQDPSHEKYGKDLCAITNTVRTYMLVAASRLCSIYVHTYVHMHYRTYRTTVLLRFLCVDRTQSMCWRTTSPLTPLTTWRTSWLNRCCASLSLSLGTAKPRLNY